MEGKNYGNAARKAKLAKDLGPASLGEKVCRRCEGELRLGKASDGKTWLYCPHCKEKMGLAVSNRKPQVIIPQRQLVSSR